MRCVLLYMLEVVEGALCLLEVLEGGGGDALRATPCAGGCGGVLCLLEDVGGDDGAGSDTLRAALYAGGCGG